MQCPVCGGECVRDVEEIVGMVPAVFSPCGACRAAPLDKAAPLPQNYEPAAPCSCGRRFIDDVFAAIYLALREEGAIAGTEPLRAAGTPVVHPAFALAAPPFLPARSLVLLSSHPDRRAAERIVREVPEVRGVVRTGRAVPGLGRDGPAAHELLAGCDVQANLFPTSIGEVVVYKELSRTHIEFPRPVNPKIRAVEREVGRHAPHTFVDACCGAGTLGLAAALAGVPEVVFCDAHGPATFWTAVNIRANRGSLLVDEVAIHAEREKIPEVRDEPVLIAEAWGDQHLLVYHGDLARLPPLLERSERSLAALDIFGKEDPEACGRVLSAWRGAGGGKAFIP
ncbi:MAG: hypothetical protein PHP59_07260 [Methanofollis sp.]|uniref:hypothetical protein n=1 Tax=Methanofollis sp. TaxID=2052835 RepID=UPI002624D87C|nr:hypothetical protein [Methanofollis sp.]MDD4255161.1 hypothetical protein [Methanofollis sp.]